MRNLRHIIPAYINTQNTDISPFFQCFFVVFRGVCKICKTMNIHWITKKRVFSLFHSSHIKQWIFTICYIQCFFSDFEKKHLSPWPGTCVFFVTSKRGAGGVSNPRRQKQCRRRCTTGNRTYARRENKLVTATQNSHATYRRRNPIYIGI